MMFTCNACGLTVHASEWVEHRETDCCDSHDAKRREARQAAAVTRQARAEALDVARSIDPRY